ncbi:oligosaccharide flippase family protein [Vagococcus vulneris]|uniref:Uncharacterized protein n=1 Tax=Vagococcus vulneris TaxID=1977869 RepID=A0A429ZZY6_9ENTE|nr:polysaccharide biosynthesis C-terminal domain-containing protein [Vagococcus vulneris]RST99573.1 hypothetical protein CBF37_04395 [Vagococcus vulneris]
MNKRVLINFSYQALYQLTLIILPIITIPVVSHALGAHGIGTYNYITSIVSYFVLCAGLGLANYGIREVASTKNDKSELSNVFWSLEIFNVIIAVCMIILYFIFISFTQNKQLFIISSLPLIATLFDISWFYYGIQDFKHITIINIFIKIVSFILILIFINNSSDLNIYFLIQGLSILLSNLALWIFLHNKISFVKPSLTNIFSHFKPAMSFFIGKASITIYTTLNKTLLGILSTVTAVGIYTNSLQLVLIFTTLIGTVDTVLMPHMTSLYSDNNEKQMIKVMEKMVDLQLFFSIPIMFGIILVNPKMILWFFGEDFNYLRYTVPVLSPLVIIMPLGISIVRQYLMPKNMIKNFNYSVLASACIGLITNLILIPKIGIWGAIVATILSECVVTIIRLRDLLKYSNFKLNLKDILIYVFCSIVMFIGAFVISINLSSNVWTTLIQGVVGLVIYLILTSIFKSNKIYMILKNVR